MTAGRVEGRFRARAERISAREIVHALGNAKRAADGWWCRCPLAEEHSHGDATPSFSVGLWVQLPLTLSRSVSEP